MGHFSFAFVLKGTTLLGPHFNSINSTLKGQCDVDVQTITALGNWKCALGPKKRKILKCIPKAHPRTKTWDMISDSGGIVSIGEKEKECDSQTSAKDGKKLD